MNINEFLSDPVSVEALTVLEYEVGEWASETFPNDRGSIVGHVMKELAEAFQSSEDVDRTNYRFELIDVALILCHWSKLEGVSLVKIIQNQRDLVTASTESWLDGPIEGSLNSNNQIFAARVFYRALERYFDDGATDFMSSARAKFEIAKGRKWELDENGVAHHVEDTQASVS